MRFYRNYDSVPELGGLSPADQGRVWRRAAKRWWYRPAPAILLIAMSVGMVSFIKFVVRVSGGSLLIGFAVILPVAWVVGGLYGSFLAGYARPYLQAARHELFSEAVDR